MTLHTVVVAKQNSTSSCIHRKTHTAALNFLLAVKFTKY